MNATRQHDGLFAAVKLYEVGQTVAKLDEPLTIHLRSILLEKSTHLLFYCLLDTLAILLANCALLEYLFPQLPELLSHPQCCGLIVSQLICVVWKRRHILRDR